MMEKTQRISLQVPKSQVFKSKERSMMFFNPIADHLSHQNTLNQVGVWKRKICHGRSVVILQPSADVFSQNKFINKDESGVVVIESVLVWPFNMLINEPSTVLLRVLSTEPDSIVEPSGEKQQ